MHPAQLSFAFAGVHALFIQTRDEAYGKKLGIHFRQGAQTLRSFDTLQADSSILTKLLTRAGPTLESASMNPHDVPVAPSKLDVQNVVQSFRTSRYRVCACGVFAHAVKCCRAVIE